MNIFAVDESPTRAAESLCDAHVTKMTVETAQLLSTAVTETLGVDHNKYGLYRKTHVNHPSNIWCRASKSNFEWLVFHGRALAKEYKYRYNASKDHKSLSVILNASKFANYMPPGNRTRFLLAMPSEFYRDSDIESYRMYYRFKKKDMKLFRYTKREEPSWMN